MKRRLVSVSPWILAAACTLLAVIIGVFAVSNYRREKQLMTDALVQKGMSVIRYIENGVLVSMRANWQSASGSQFGWVEHAQGVIEQIIDQPDIHFIELLNTDGIVLAATDTERVGKKAKPEILEFVNQFWGVEATYRMQLEDSGEKQQGFQVFKTFKPRLRGPMFRGNQRNRPMMDRMFGKNPDFMHMQQEMEKLRSGEFAVLVELDLKQYNSAVNRQLLEIIILSIILLLVGVGGWLSLLTLQGFKGTQSRLRKISAFNDILVESLPVGLIATDREGRIQVVNMAAETIAGISAKDMRGAQSSEVLPGELAQMFAENHMTGAEPASVEMELTSSDGSSRNLLVTGLSVADARGEYTGKVVLMQDVSALRRLETELRRSERLAALGKMAAGVAHELRNPLSSIKGLAILLKKKTAGDKEGVQTAEVLVQEVERLNRSIGELLDYARPEQLQLQPVPLAKILREAEELVAIDTSSLGITHVSEYQDNGDLVMADADKMKQVFLNLLLNGIQAMKDGGELSLRTETKDKNFVCTITDTGEGIGKECLTKVFDPYFTTKNEGTGLGLSLSAKIIEEHGGEISIKSESGKGTTVVVEMPLHDES